MMDVKRHELMHKEHYFFLHIKARLYISVDHGIPGKKKCVSHFSVVSSCAPDYVLLVLGKAFLFVKAFFVFIVHTA